MDETRPRNQGAALTAWELGSHGVPHTIVVDNAGGHLMQHGLVDIVITGTDRTTRCGDVANKIGTYLKALAARDNDVPFYVALPSTTIDWTIADGLRAIVGQRNFRVIREKVREVLTVDDQEIREAMVLFWRHCRLLIEPSSATVIAALRRYPDRFAGRKVGAILSGGNIHPADWVTLTGDGSPG